MKIAPTLEQLEALGFDKSAPFGECWSMENRIAVGCSRCQSLIINGTPTHETGCPNQKHECRGCNELLPRNRTWCEDCQ